MKFLGVLSIVMACAVPQITFAANEVTPEQLAGMAAALESCGRVDHRDIKRLEELAEGLLKGVPEKRVESTRRSPEYNAAYPTYVAFFRGLATDYTAEFAELCHSVAMQGTKAPRD